MTEKCFFLPFVGDSIGGSQISTIELIKNLQDSGIETLVVIHMDDILSKLLKKNRVSFSILPISRDKLNGSIINTIIIVITKFLSFRKFIYRNDINIIYTNDIRMHYIWSVSSYIIKNVKHIWHQHSAIYSRRNIIFSALSFQKGIRVYLDLLILSIISLVFKDESIE